MVEVTQEHISWATSIAQHLCHPADRDAAIRLVSDGLARFEQEVLARASTAPDAEPVVWLGPIPHDGGEKPTWVPDDAIVMIAFNPREYQDRMTWNFAEKRKAPAHERDWEAATAFCIQTPLYTHPAKPVADPAASVELLREALEHQMEARVDDMTPLSVHRDNGRVWLEGWFDLSAALAAMGERS